MKHTDRNLRVIDNRAAILLLEVPDKHVRTAAATTTTTTTAAVAADLPTVGRKDYGT